MAGYTKLVHEWTKAGNIARMGDALPTYLALLSFANQVGRCHPKHQSIAGVVGASDRTIRRHLKTLVDLGQVVIEHRGQDRNHYLVAFPEGLASVFRSDTHVLSEDAEIGHPCPPDRTPVSGRDRTPVSYKRRTRKRSSKKNSFSSQDEQTAKWIWDLIHEMQPTRKLPPKLDGWANDIRLMRERDGRTDGQIREVFRWANQDGFWRQNILSPRKLRDKFDDLELRMRGSSNGKPKLFTQPDAGAVSDLEQRSERKRQQKLRQKQLGKP